MKERPLDLIEAATIHHQAPLIAAQHRIAPDALRLLRTQVNPSVGRRCLVHRRKRLRIH